MSMRRQAKTMEKDVDISFGQILMMMVCLSIRSGIQATSDRLWGAKITGINTSRLMSAEMCNNHKPVHSLKSICSHRSEEVGVVDPPAHGGILQRNQGLSRDKQWLKAVHVGFTATTSLQQTVAFTRLSFRNSGT